MNNNNKQCLFIDLDADVANVLPYHHALLVMMMISWPSTHSISHTAEQKEAKKSSTFALKKIIAPLTLEDLYNGIKRTFSFDAKK